MQGLFVGLTTLDLIYLAEHPPVANQKLVAADYSVSAGGPATNAAIAFGYLGGGNSSREAHGTRHATTDIGGLGEMASPQAPLPATVVSSLGCHPMTHLIRADLARWGVALHDLSPERADPPPVSSIMVTAATGERAVISINAMKLPIPGDRISLDILKNIDVLLIDGHQLAVSHLLATHAKSLGIPIVIDGGSWKPGFETVLSLADYAICSANFHPPNCPSESATIAYLQALGIPHIAITHGEHPIWYCDRDQVDQLTVPTIQPVDTLGAGDIFHGAFCYYILQTHFPAALQQASHIAATACQFFGTRRWMEGQGKVED